MRITSIYLLVLAGSTARPILALPVPPNPNDCSYPECAHRRLSPPPHHSQHFNVPNSWPANNNTLASPPDQDANGMSPGAVAGLAVGTFGGGVGLAVGGAKVVKLIQSKQSPMPHQEDFNRKIIPGKTTRIDVEKYFSPELPPLPKTTSMTPQQWKDYNLERRAAYRTLIEDMKRRNVEMFKATKGAVDRITETGYHVLALANGGRIKPRIPVV